VVIEHAAREQRGCKQRAGPLGELLDRRLRARAHDPPTRKKDRTFCPREHLRQLIDLPRMGRQRLGRRQHG
jgi:hypothetical protein